MSLEDELTTELHGTYEAARKRGYVATYFLQMLEEHGGVGMARRLLAQQEIQQGLMRLAELDLLHESMEAVVLQDKYRSLFEGQPVDYLGEARRRLQELGYFKEGKQNGKS